jgi:hypothetical protein
MLGPADPQPSMCSHLNLAQSVTGRIIRCGRSRPVIDTVRIRQLCEPL